MVDNNFASTSVCYQLIRSLNFLSRQGNELCLKTNQYNSNAAQILNIFYFKVNNVPDGIIYDIVFFMRKV